MLTELSDRSSLRAPAGVHRDASPSRNAAGSRRRARKPSAQHRRVVAGASVFAMVVALAVALLSSPAPATTRVTSTAHAP